MPRGRLWLGTSSWSEKAWKGVFYPPGLPPGEQLTYYATRHDTVEADVTYYRVPDENLVRGWDRKTPPGFRLSAKFPRSIVHGGDGPRPDPERVLELDRVGDDLREFLRSMSLLGEKRGPLVLQFPYFDQQVFPALGPFLQRLATFLDALPLGPRYAVEVRNKAWVGVPLLECLRERNVAFVLVDLAYLPHPSVFARRYDLVTADFAYARLIGDRKRVDSRTDTLDHVVLDQGRRLEAWSRTLADLLQRVPEVHCYANNHFAGYAPATVDDLAGRLAALGAIEGPSSGG
jgi:uncharacterized protein YecE (DUF72 family)